MGELQSHIFGMIAVLCFIFSFTVYIHFLYSMNHTRTSKILRILSTVSLTGYNTHIMLSCLLFIYDSIYYISPHLPYHWLLCTSHTFNIIFFMIGKMSMYYFFLSLVHVAFRGSFIQYHKSILKLIAIIFTVIMFLIFIAYTYSFYIDIQNIGIITSPIHCHQLSVSTLSSITIWTGSTMDASWSILCLCLFYYKLRQLLRAMRELSLSDMMSTTKSEISEFDHQIRTKHSLRSTSPKSATKTLEKRPSLHQKKSTPTRIIARRSELVTIENLKKDKSRSSSKRNTMTATGMGIGRTSGITPMITPYDNNNNTPAMISMQYIHNNNNNKVRPSALGHPTFDSPVPEHSYPMQSTSDDTDDTDKENTVNIDSSNPSSRRTTGTATSSGNTMDALISSKLNLSVSTPSTTPIPLPPSSGRDTQVRLSTLLDKTETVSINEDAEVDTDEYTIQNINKRDTHSLFQSTLPSMNEDQEYVYDGRQEVDDMGNICIVYDDDDEEVKLPEATLGKTNSDSIISNNDSGKDEKCDNDNNNDNKQQQETVENDQEKLPESTLRRIITDSDGDELNKEHELQLTDIEEEDGQKITAEMEIVKIEHDKTDKSEVISGEKKVEIKVIKKKVAESPKIANFGNFDSVVSRTRSQSRNTIYMKRYVVNQFLPIVFKLSLLSFWCAVSTVLLGFLLWTLYPTISSLIDSTINGLCVYLAFAFAKPLYHILCLPCYSCSNCQEMRNILNEAENGANHNKQHSII